MSRLLTQLLRSKMASCSRTFSVSAFRSKLRMALAGKKETSVRPQGIFVLVLISCMYLLSNKGRTLLRQMPEQTNHSCRLSVPTCSQKSPKCHQPHGQEQGQQRQHIERSKCICNGSVHVECLCKMLQPIIHTWPRFPASGNRLYIYTETRDLYYSILLQEDKAL